MSLNSLDVSASPLAVAKEEKLRDFLAREARRADWGAGRGARIEYRFRIDELTTKVDAGVLRVTCSATGWLPKGRTAKSHLTFGGAPSEQERLVDHVLEIVSSGVVTRLAEIERRRRAAR